MEEVFEVWDRILLRTFEPQGEIVPQERVLSHSVQQRIVLLAVDLPNIDPVLQVFVATQGPVKVCCRLFVGRGCVRGYWCSFAHAAAELHPLAPDLLLGY